MPRKPRPALPTLHIEGLSSGQSMLRDDFTGQVIPQANAKPRKSSAEYVAQRKAQREQAQLHVLVDAGLGRLIGHVPEPRLVEVVPKGKRKVAEFNGKAVLMDLPKWRRT